jgi:tetratricopeptide (TPR) repeat protein
VATPAAASLAALAPGETQQLLAELVRGNLLTEAVPGRYALHDLLRAYAEELATADDPAADRRAALQRALDHYLHTAVTAVRRRSPYRIGIEPDPPADGVRPDDPQDVFAWFRAEDEVLREALRQSAAQGFDRHTWQLAWALADEYGLAGRWQEWADSQETGLAAARRLGDRRGQANAHRSLGRALAWLRRYDDGHAHLTRAFTLFGELGVPADQANTQLGISWLLDQQGRHREALDHDERARELYAAAGHRSGEAIALTAIAWDLGQLGEHERSLSYTRQALDVHEELGNLHGQESSWSNFGNAYLRLNRHAEAISAYENAVACARRKGDRTAEAYDLRMLGDAQEAAGRMAAARKSWTAALEILDDIEHPDAAEVRGRLTTLGAG